MSGVGAEREQLAFELGGVAEGARRAQEGMDRAYDAAPTTWKAEAGRALRFLVERHEHVTADLVWLAMQGRVEGFEPAEDVPPAKGQALGAVIQAAARAGLIENTYRHEPSCRPERHKGSVAVWRSRRWRPEE